MVRKLTKLRIDEISSVDRGAGDGCRIVLMKRNDPVDDDPTPGALLETLDHMVQAMVTADPSLTEEQHLHTLLHTALNEISKATTNPEEEYDMDMLQKLMNDNAALAKRLAALEDGAVITKMATDNGLPETEAATVQAALKGDAKAMEKLLGFIKCATAAAESGGMFKEFGTATHGTAYDELVAKAKELRKDDSKLSFHAAFAKVYEDPDNIAIVRRERDENRPQ